MASNAVENKDTSLCKPSVLPFTLEDIQRIIDAQTAIFSEKFANILTDISTIKTTIQSLSCDLAELRQRALAVETSCEKVTEKQKELRVTVEDLQEDIVEMKKDLGEELDKLEAISRRDNLKFFNIPEPPDESYESCADKVVNVLQNTVPDKTWCLDDVVRAHRLGVRTGKSLSNPRPMIVKMTRWKDKMAIFTSGREALKKKGIKVAGDLTTRQRVALKEQRDRGMHAYFKAGKLIVTGPLRPREDRRYQPEVTRKQISVSSSSGRQPSHHSGAASNGASALLNPSEWPAVRSSHQDRPATPSKRPRLTSSLETSMEEHTTADQWA